VKTAKNIATQNEVLLIAPCGMNCGLCMAYLREKNKCPGCRGEDAIKLITRTNCRIKNCVALEKGNNNFCFTCEKYPCERLKHLDKRYRTKYNMSMIENLDNIKKSGIKKFIKNEKERWMCPNCGGTICVHKGYCYSCKK
jgi:hypothetical protein